MPSIFVLANRIANRSAWLALLPTLIVCSGDKSTGTTETPPGTVSDLSVSAIANTSVTLTFTQVDDGTGQAANYDVRYAVAPMSWGSANSTASGTCATPVAGTGVGSTLTCSILGLSPSTNYNFQLIAFRGTLTTDAVFGGASNVASASTTTPPPPPPVVTTVTVTPPSASMAVGATVALSATVKDAQGNVMTGQTITWSTSNAAAATVNSNGVVTGVAAGSATITAACSGKTGSSAVTVTAAPPPPPPGGTLLFQENFEDANLASRGWYDNTGAVLSTTEHIAGSNSSAEYRFMAGATTPTSGGAQRHKFTPTNSFYLSYYVKYSANWVGSNQLYHPHEFQAMSTLDGDYDGPSNGYMVVYVEQNYQNGGKPRLAMQDNQSVNSSYGPLPYNLVGVTENRSTGGCNGLAETNMLSECYDAGGYWYNLKQLLGPVVFQPNPGPGYKNDWNFVEAFFQLNTVVNGIGQADGVMQYWFNGTLIFDRHDILYRTGAHPTLQFNQFLIAPYIGDGSPLDQSMFIDSLRLATSRIP
jgi:hypothetical protein